MSPEQIDPSRVVDFRADLWSLSVIACECLTGRRPFEGDTLASLAMKISLGRSELPSSLAPVPRGFDAWFARGTEVDPKRRFGSALELATALRELVESGDMVASPASKAPRPATTRHELTPSVLGLSARAAGPGETAGGRRSGGRGAAFAAGAVLLGGAGVWWGITRVPARDAGALSEANAGAPSVIAAPLSASPAAGADAGAPQGAHGDGTARNARREPERPPTPRVGVVGRDTRPETTRPDGVPGAAPRATSSPSAPPRERGRGRHRTGAQRPNKSAAPATPTPPQPVDPYDLL
jgi:hypothetical protein